MKTAGKMVCATLAFALLHSALASRAAKQAAAGIAGERRAHATYRLFYVGQSFLSFFGLLAYGSRLPKRTLYRVGGPARLVLRFGQAAGFVHLLAAARPSGLLRLAGWRNLQAYRQQTPIAPGPAAQGPEEGADGALQVAGPLCWSRHPLNFTGMPIFWLTPHMTTRRLAFNLVSSAYFILGSLHEEARLVAAYGERYRRYQCSGVPFFWPRPPALQPGKGQAMRTETRRVRGDGLDLHVEVTGVGPPVILLHGFPESGHSWRKQVGPLVDAGYAAWVPNLRGYPPSDVSPRQGDYHLRHLAADVAAIVETSGHPRAHVVGHDWGGLIAWTFAGLYPALLDRLVIMNAPHMAIFSAKVWNSSQALRSLYAGFFQLPLLPEALLAAADYRIVRTMFAAMPLQKTAFGPDDIQVYIDGLSRPGALKAALDYYRENMRSDGMALAASVHTDAETLVIWGEKDPALGIFLLTGLARYAPRVRIHRIGTASHWVQNEAAVEVNQALLKFLRG